MRDEVAMAPKRRIDALKSFLMDDEGQDLVEYALIAILMALASVTIFNNLTTHIATVFSYVGTTLTAGV
jgi:pilus assembly protein Flp/PilA